MQQPQLLLDGKYEILAKIRDGGMGTVYRVRHRLLDEIRVVKAMRPHAIGNADLKRRFLEEAKTAIRLKHPNICSIYDFAADENGTTYLVMEHIDGVNLADFVKACGFPGVPFAIQLAHQSLLALGYLHRKGIIHRDIAPDNLMLTYDDERHLIVKLIDLGIAKAVNRDMDMTATGVFLGKPRYASPEQLGLLDGGMKLDGRADLYALGVVLYEVLTGSRPFAGKSPLELLRAQHLNLLIPFEDSDPHGRVPPPLRAAILKALQKRRDDRFASAEEFDQQIVSLMDQYSARRGVDITPALLSSIRAELPGAPATVTPGAQDRLDQHFGPQATPSPAPLLTAMPLEPVGDDALQTVRLRLDRSEPSSPIPERESRPTPIEPVDRTEVIRWLPADIGTVSGSSTAGPRQAPIPDGTPSPQAVAGASATPATSATPPKSSTPSPSAAAGRDDTPRRALEDASLARTGTPSPFATPRRDGTPRGAAEDAFLARTETPSPSAAHGERDDAPRRAAAEGAPAPPARTGTPSPYVGPARADIGMRPAWLRSPQATWIAVILAAAIAASAVLLLVYRWSSPSPPEVHVATVPRVQAPSQPVVSEAPPPAAPSLPVSETVAKPAPAPAEPPTLGSEELAAKASEASAAHRDADEARGADFAPTTYQRAVARESLAKTRAEQGAEADAMLLFDEATALYGRAAAIGRAQVHPAAPEAPRIRNAPGQARHPSSSSPATEPDPAVVAEARSRITRVVGDYAWARRTRNARLFAQVFPSDLAAFQRSLEMFEQQDVRLDIQSIDLEGSRAVVSANETVIATPRSGNAERTESRIVLQVDKRRGRWVIVSRR